MRGGLGAYARSALLSCHFPSKGPFPASVLQWLTLMLYVGCRLQLFQQSLSRAMITNDSVSGRKSSPWQIDSKTQASGRRKAEAVLTEEKKKWNKTSRWNHPEGLVWHHYCGEGKAEVAIRLKGPRGPVTSDWSLFLKRLNFCWLRWSAMWSGRGDSRNKRLSQTLTLLCVIQNVWAKRALF